MVRTFLFLCKDTHILLRDTLNLCPACIFVLYCPSSAAGPYTWPCWANHEICTGPSRWHPFPPECWPNLLSVHWIPLSMSPTRMLNSAGPISTLKECPWNMLKCSLVCSFRMWLSFPYCFDYCFVLHVSIMGAF